MHNEKLLSSETLYEGKIINLKKCTVELENGSTAIREIVEHRGGVSVLALDDRDQVLFVRQFRFPYGQVLLELPAGKLEQGEDPAACGLRELEEETGYTCGELCSLGQVYPTPGYVTEVLHLYLAKDLVRSRQRLDEDEFLTVEKIPFQKALELCVNGGIKDGKTAVSILKYAVMRAGLTNAELTAHGLPAVGKHGV